MSSILKVDQLQDSGGNAIITSDGAGSITTPGITTGKVLQVLYATINTTTTTTSTSFVDTGLSIDITPSSTSSKILVLVNSGGYVATTGTMYLTIAKDSTNVGGANGFNYLYSGGAAGDDIVAGFTATHLSSPATTSSVNYKAQFRSGDGSTVYISNGNIISSITAMEIAG
tara:strand:+ start:561 stop:1073 length:513 start_codon:yes stop_codon:yes gene_type:complete